MENHIPEPKFKIGQQVVSERNGELEPFTHCDFCDAEIREEEHALEDGGHHFCDDDCMYEFNS